MKFSQLAPLLGLKEFLQRQNHAGYCTFIRTYPHSPNHHPNSTILQPLLLTSWKGAETCVVLHFYELREVQNGVQVQAFLGPVPARRGGRGEVGIREVKHGT